MLVPGTLSGLCICESENLIMPFVLCSPGKYNFATNQTEEQTHDQSGGKEGILLTKEEEVKKRWKHFAEVLNRPAQTGAEAVSAACEAVEIEMGPVTHAEVRAQPTQNPKHINKSSDEEWVRI